MNISQGSLEELRYYLLLARDLEYLPTGGAWPEVDEVARLERTSEPSCLLSPDDMTT
jgi:hypothetical protein